MPQGPTLNRQRILRMAPVALAVGLPLFLFLVTLYPGVGDRQGTGDAIEYQLVGKVLSIPHEPGYPQYVLLSHLWSYLPLPLSLATKINLLSAAFSTVAGLFLFATARRLSQSDAAAIIATWMVLLTPSVWLLSTQAEVYSLHLLWVSAVIWAALNWCDTGKHGFLVGLFFFYALSFGNHLTMITLLPALVFLVLSRDPKVLGRWQNWAWAGLAIVCGLFQYGLLVWRSYHPHPTLLHRFPLQASFSQLWDYVIGSRFVDRHFLKTGAEGWSSGLWDALVNSGLQLTLPFALVCGYGYFLYLRRHPRQATFLTLIGGGVLAFAAAYGIKDSLLYTMPAWLCAGLMGAVGFSAILQWLDRWRTQVVVAVLILLGILIAWRATEMRVEENYTDLEAVIDVAEPGTGVLAAFKQRRARLLGLYYRYGEVLDKAQELSFHSVNEVLATGLEDAQDQPLYFRDQRSANTLYQSIVDFRPLPTSSDAQTLYVTAGTPPLESLELRPLWNGSLAISIRDRSLDLLGDRALHLFLVSTRYKRTKGYLALEVDKSSKWVEGLEDALAVASPTDRFLLVAPPLEETSHTLLADVLRSHGIDLGTVPRPEHQTVIWWLVGEASSEIVLMSDLEDELTLALENP